MYFQKGEFQLFYSKVGKGLPIVALHGWGQDSSSFWNIVDELSENFTLYLLDLPSFGRSNLPKDNLKIKDYADLVASFIKSEKLKKPVLLGHSLGGRVGIKLAVLYPNLIYKLILEDSAGIKPKKTVKTQIYFVIAKLIKYLVPNIGMKNLIRYYFYKAIGSDYLDAGERRQTYLNIINEDLTPDLDKIEHDTLLIWGEKDNTVPLSDGKRMYQRIPNSRLEVIEGASHFPHLENPKLFNHYVKDFI